MLLGHEAMRMDKRSWLTPGGRLLTFGREEDCWLDKPVCPLPKTIRALWNLLQFDETRTPGHQLLAPGGAAGSSPLSRLYFENS